MLSGIWLGENSFVDWARCPVVLHAGGITVADAGMVLSCGSARWWCLSAANAGMVPSCGSACWWCLSAANASMVPSCGSGTLVASLICFLVNSAFLLSHIEPSQGRQGWP